MIHTYFRIAIRKPSCYQQKLPHYYHIISRGFLFFLYYVENFGCQLNIKYFDKIRVLATCHEKRWPEIRNFNINYRLPGGGVRVEIEVGSPHPLLSSQNLEYQTFLIMFLSLYFFLLRKGF